MVLRQTDEDLWLPTPILKHLRRGFDEIAWALGQPGGVPFALGTKTVHNVTKFVKKSDDVAYTRCHQA
jgi:hypothetical protein